MNVRTAGCRVGRKWRKGAYEEEVKCRRGRGSDVLPGADDEKRPLQGSGLVTPARMRGSQ